MKNLETGLAQLNISFTLEQFNKLLMFVELLCKWNKVYNLTAVRKPEDMVSLHLLDSLSLLPYLDNCKRLLDVGSGAGLPGIPLAIFKPEQQFVLLDSNVKKTRFIQQAIINLNLKNVQVVHERVEKYQPDILFDCLTTRAFATMAETLKLVEHLLAKQTRLMFMKSNTADSELKQIESNFSHEIKELSVPGIEANRRLVILSR
jgi:16S rRNA (guanine527-N7)-methyltransferase